MTIIKYGTVCMAVTVVSAQLVLLQQLTMVTVHYALTSAVRHSVACHPCALVTFGRTRLHTVDNFCVSLFALQAIVAWQYVCMWSGACLDDAGARMSAVGHDSPEAFY